MSEQADPRTPEEIRHDIEQTREELADTAAALAYKADVKARAHDKVEEMKAHAAERVQEARASVTGAPQSTTQVVRSNPVPVAAIAVALLSFALGYYLRHRDR